MREIKFRAWVSLTGKYQWADEVEVNSDGSWGFMIGPEGNQYGSEGGDGDFLEQFTGLKDKNGREIYEGDIGRRMIQKSNFNPGGGMGQPRLDQPATKWWEEERIAKIEIFDDGTPLFWHQCLSRKDWSEIEVIGNIHENPELLKS